MKTNYPDRLTIQQYLEGKLGPEAAHELEKQALEDPFLWDALDGYSVYRDSAADLSILQRQLHERIVHLQENKKVFDLTWQRLSVAAAAAVMFVSAGILFWMNSHNSPEQLASQSRIPVEVNVIDKDSVEAMIGSKDKPVIASLTKKGSGLNQPAISEDKQRHAIDNKSSVSSTKPENTGAAIIASPPQGGSSAPSLDDSEVRQAKIARVGEDKGSLNEVVIRSGNAPKSGWLSYRKYVNLNTARFNAAPRLKGSVLLAFQVGTDGKPINIKVIESLSEAYDKEAIRILRNGSDWTPASDRKGYESRLEVSFQ